MYSKATENSINANLIAPIKIKGLPIKREFNFVWLKNSKFSYLYQEFFKKCHEIND